MKHPIIVGLQYGDEGKGKITDILARQADYVIRFNGGNNAGHTLWIDGKKLVTHSVPSGILSDHAVNFIGAACVIDPLAFKGEIEELTAGGVNLDQGRLKIDYRAHLILPAHRKLDGARESSGTKIGTTLRGIGPTYSSKMDRTGVRVADLFDEKAEDKLQYLVKILNSQLRALEQEESPFEENLKVFKLGQEVLRRYVSNDVAPFFELAKTKKCVLEGAQGVMLDLDHGSYPFVTSSNTVGPFAAVGTPFPMSRLGEVIGVAKAYLTRVGEGPFNTQMDPEAEERIQKNGGEFGATTGRSRKCGWLNLDELKDAVQISDCTGIVLSKGDVLSGEAEVFAHFDGSTERFEGWKSVTIGEGKDQKLHPSFADFVDTIEDFVGVPIIAVGTGADRKDLFWRNGEPEFWSPN